MTNNPYASPAVKQAIEDHKPRHMATDKAYPNQGRNQTVTQRVLSFNLTSDKATGVGRWEVITHDANGSHTNRFKEADPVASQLFTRWVPFDRNQIVHLDSAWDLTWKNVDGWAAAVSFQEVTDMPNEPITAPLKNAAERKRAKDAAEVKDAQPRPTDFEDHDPARFKLFFGWYNGECDLRKLTDETAKNEIRRRAAQIAGGVDSFKDLPDNVTWEQLKAIVLEILKVEYTRKPTKEAWLDWLRARGYNSDYILPILSEYQQKAGGKPVDKFSDYNGELSDAERDIAAFQTERKDKPSGSRNGHSQSSGATTPTSDEPAKPLPQSEAKTMGSETVDIKDKIREKYNKPQRGNDYLTVQGRILLFRADHPDWTIDTDIIAVTDTTAVIKATVKNAEGRVIATGHGRATEAGTKNLGGRFVEKAETAAIGRALATAGYGTDDTLDDADYLSDSPVEQRKTG